MVTVKEIYDAIDREAPFSTAMSFDNVGILVGDGDKKVRRALIALDITGSVIREAKDKKADLIISHHPVIFDPLKSVNWDSPVYKLISLGISAIACHTNLDICPAIGVNRSLFNELGLENFCKTGDCLFTGELSTPITVKTFAELVNNRLNTVCAVTCPEKIVKKVSFCSGAGGEFISEAMTCSEVFLTGEAHHDELIFAKERDFPVVVAGHYATEKPFGGVLKKYLEENIAGTEFILSEAEENPTTII